MNRVAVVLAMLLVVLLAWVSLHSSDISIVVNGEKLAGPAKLAAEGWAILVAGVGLIALGALVLAGFLAAWLAFPFLLPLLIPLLAVWIFVAATRRRGKSRTQA